MERFEDELAALIAKHLAADTPHAEIIEALDLHVGFVSEGEEARLAQQDRRASRANGTTQ